MPSLRRFSRYAFLPYKPYNLNRNYIFQDNEPEYLARRESRRYDERDYISECEKHFDEIDQVENLDNCELGTEYVCDNKLRACVLGNRMPCNRFQKCQNNTSCCGDICVSEDQNLCRHQILKKPLFKYGIPFRGEED